MVLCGHNSPLIYLLPRCKEVRHILLIAWIAILLSVWATGESLICSLKKVLLLLGHLSPSTNRTMPLNMCLCRHPEQTA